MTSSFLWRSRRQGSGTHVGVRTVQRPARWHETMHRQRRREVSRRTGAAGFALPVTSALTLLIVVVTMPTALGSGVRAHPPAAGSPPYNGSEFVQNQVSVTNCGRASASAKIPVPAEFDFTTGIGGARDSASARSCSNGVSSVGRADGQLSAYVTVPTVTGFPTIYVNGSYALKGNLALSQGSCTRLATIKSSYCDRASEVEGFVDAFFDNQTSGTGTRVGFVSFDNSTYNYTSCHAHRCSSATSGTGGTAGVFSLSGSFAWSLYLPYNLSGKASYALEIDFMAVSFGECLVHNFVLKGCSASAALNIATGGGDFVISSVVVT